MGGSNLDLWKKIEKCWVSNSKLNHPYSKHTKDDTISPYKEFHIIFDDGDEIVFKRINDNELGMIKNAIENEVSSLRRA